MAKRKIRKKDEGYKKREEGQKQKEEKIKVENMKERGKREGQEQININGTSNFSVRDGTGGKRKGRSERKKRESRI